MERGTHICMPTNAKVWLITTLIITSFGFQPCPSYGDQHGAADKGEVSVHSHWPPRLILPLSINY